MKLFKFKLFFLLFIVSLHTYSQNDNSGLFVGQPDIQLPIWSTEVDGLNLGISINYSSSGVMASNKGGNIGIGWNLNVGGLIYRELRDIPDEYYLKDIGLNNFGIPYEKGQICGWLFGPQKIESNGSISYLPTSRNYWQTLPTNTNDLATYLGKSYEYATTVNDIEPPGDLDLYYDHEPDLFHFSFLGRNGTFIFEPSPTYPNGTFKIYQIPFQDLLIDFELLNNLINSFTIIDGNGYKYSFSQKGNSTTVVKGLNDRYQSSINCIDAWFLTKIESPFHNEISFEYCEEYELLNYGNEDGYIHIYDRVSFQENLTYTAWTSIISELPRLSRIKIKNLQVEFNYNSENRLDLTYESESSRALNSISIYSLIGENKNKVKDIFFGTNYFNTHGLEGTGVLGKKLVLSSIYSCINGINQPSIVFDYNYDEVNNILLPNIKSNAVDYWGYYNGSSSVNGNEDPSPILYQTITDGHKQVYLYPPQNTSFTQIYSKIGYWYFNAYYYKLESGRDRRPNPSLNSRGILKSISNQSGGTTYYTWETNMFNYNGKVEYGPGLRIAKIESVDESNSYVKEYSYNQTNDLNTSSGSIATLPIYHTRIICSPEDLYQCIEVESSDLNGCASYISYSKVTEYIGTKGTMSNGDPFGANGKKVYEFNNPGTVDLLNDELGLYVVPTNHAVTQYGDIYNSTDLLPEGPNLNYDWVRGTLKQIEVYDSSNKLKRRISATNQLFCNNSTPKYINGIRINRLYLDYELTYFFNHYPIILEVSNIPKTFIITDFLNIPIGINSVTQQIDLIFDSKQRLKYKKETVSDGKIMEYLFTYSDQYWLLDGETSTYHDAVNYMILNHINNYIIEKVNIEDGYVVGGSLNIPGLFNSNGGEFVANNQLYQLAPLTPKSKTSFTYSTPTVLYIQKDADYVIDKNNFVYNGESVEVQHSMFDGTKVFKVVDLNQKAIVEGQNADLTNLCFKGFEITEENSVYNVKGVAHTGIQSAKATGTSEDRTYPIYLVAGKKYIIRYWTKQGNAGNISTSVSINGETASITQIVPNPNDTWVMAQNEFTALSSGLKSLIIKLSSGNAIQYHYVDDLQVFPVGADFTMNTFDPITSQTTSSIDSRGNTRKMEYDVYGRFNTVRDKDDYILHEKRYNSTKSPIITEISKLEFGLEGGTKEITVNTPLSFDILVIGDNFLTTTKINATTISINCPSNTSGASQRRALIYLYHTLHPEEKIAIEVIQAKGRFVGSTFDFNELSN